MADVLGDVQDTGRVYSTHSGMSEFVTVLTLYCTSGPKG